MPLWTPSQLPPMYIEGFGTFGTGAAGNHHIRPGRCRSDDNTLDITLSTTLTCLIGSNGANGLDTGVGAAGWYAQFIIADSRGINPVASLYSLSPTAPTMPSGYDKKRRANWIYATRFYMQDGYHYASTLGTPNTLGNYRVYIADPVAVDSTFRALNGGTATSSSYTAIDISSFVPTQATTCRYCKIISVFTAVTAGDAVHYATTGNAPASSIYRHVAGAAGQSTVYMDLPLDASPTIHYKIVPAGGGTPAVSVWVNGFTDHV